MNRLALTLVALALIPPACTGERALLDEAALGETSPAEEATPSPEEPSRGGRLVVAISSDPGHLNPAITTQGGTHTASELLYNGLVALNEDLEPLPELAESWEIEDDGRVYTFTLRDDVTWHDGQPFTSADVKFSFEEALLKFHSRTRASMSEALESIETPDEHTVAFRFKFPYAPLLLQLDVTEAPIIAQHVYEGTDVETAEANTNPVGTGPFKFVSYTPDAEIVFERNENYFKEGLPYLDEVVQRVMPEPASQVIALEAGEVDWLWGVPGPDLQRLDDDERFATITTPQNPGGTNCIMTMSFNLDRTMFQDVNVRRGLALAIDREAFFERILFEEGAVAEAPISSGIPFAHAEDVDVPGFDRAAAEELLNAAGWIREGDGPRTAQGVAGVQDGTAMTFDFLAFPTFARYGELLRTQLAEIGVDVVVKALEPPVFVETVFTQRNFDTNIISYCNGNDPEIGVRRMYTSANIAPIPFSNSSAYRNPRVDELFDQAARTLDREERSALYQQLQEILVEDLPYYWIVETESTRVFDANCQGFGPAGHFAETAYCDQ